MIVLPSEEACSMELYMTCVVAMKQNPDISDAFGACDMYPVATGQAWGGSWLIASAEAWKPVLERKLPMPVLCTAEAKLPCCTLFTALMPLDLHVKQSQESFKSPQIPFPVTKASLEMEKQDSAKIYSCKDD